MVPPTIVPCSREDIPTKTRLELETFRDHPRIPMQWPNGYTPDLYAYKDSGDFEAFEDPVNHFWKAVDSESGQLMGTADWSFKLNLETEIKGDGDGRVGGEKKPPPSNWPERGNWELKQFWKENFKRMEAQYLNGRDYLTLNFLCILPQFQGRGIGSKLLSWGMEEADQRHICMCLESTPAGLSLYKKAGFKVVEVISKDMREFGWTEPYDEEAAQRIFMIREPR